MQIVIKRESLLKPLQQVCGVLSSRPSIPVLNNVLLNVRGNTLTITGTDLEVELTTQAQLSSSSGDGFQTIPAKKLLDLCRTFPEDAEITVEFGGDQAVIRSGRIKVNLATISAEEYPNLVDWKPEVEFIIAQSQLYRLIESTQFSMANQDARYFLNGMKFESEGNLLRAVATDGHRLAVCTLAMQNELGQCSVIMPRKGVSELLRLLKNTGNSATMQVGTNQLRIVLDDVVFTTKLIDGRYPDYKRVLPRTAKLIAEGSCEDLKNAFTRMAILSNDKIKAVRLFFTNNKLKITATNLEQEQAEEILDINYQGQDLEIGFNILYLLDVLNALKCQQVRFRLTDANSSCLIENVEESSAEYVIMPMRI